MRAFHFIVSAGLVMTVAAPAAQFDANPTFVGGVEIPVFEVRAESASLEANEALGGGFK